MAPTQHAEKAAAFLRDAERAAWHDQALWQVRSKRDHAARAVPEWEHLRSLAAAIKQYTLSRLDECLEQFETEATRNGAVVHWARTAAEHNQIVAEILEEHRATRVVKSKSMLTEECGLNSFLEGRGIQVTDTDLGEWIVQLRGEPPSHIVLPAIHVRRREVGALFHRVLGTDENCDDPAYLTGAARQRLRACFLEADAGITGVNFAVAETGEVVVCTNEGNADLGTVLPPLHIACLGIEKLVPRLIDLGVFTRLLARSATGQPITAYTSHFRAPRPGGELHLVLVDNGRSELLGSPDFHRALRCIRCGACLNTCPVYRRSGGHSYGVPVAGPIGSILSPAREPRTHGSLPFACSLCGSCSDVCPVQIDLHVQLLSLRAKTAAYLTPNASTHGALRCAATVWSRPRLYRWLERWGRGTIRWLASRLSSTLSRKWTRQRELPEIPPASFHQQFLDQPGEPRS